MKLRPSPRWPPGDGPTRARIDPFGQSRHGVSRCLAPRSAAGYRRRGARRCSRRPERPREASGQPRQIETCEGAGRGQRDRRRARGRAALRLFTAFKFLDLGAGVIARTSALSVKKNLDCDTVLYAFYVGNASPPSLPLPAPIDLSHGGAALHLRSSHRTRSARLVRLARELTQVVGGAARVVDELGEE